MSNICRKWPTAFEKRRLRQIFAHDVSAVRDSKKFNNDEYIVDHGLSNELYTQCVRYVTTKSRKGGSESDFFVFGNPLASQSYSCSLPALFWISSHLHLQHWAHTVTTLVTTAEWRHVWNRVRTTAQWTFQTDIGTVHCRRTVSLRCKIAVSGDGGQILMTSASNQCTCIPKKQSLG